MNILVCNLRCAVVGINKHIYVKQLYGMCIILNIFFKDLSCAPHFQH
jgi:hypothetical protein